MPDEFKHRAALISRGVAYIELAEGIHYRQIERDGVRKHPRQILHSIANIYLGYFTSHHRSNLSS